MWCDDVAANAMLAQLEALHAQGASVMYLAVDGALAELLVI